MILSSECRSRKPVEWPAFLLLQYGDNGGFLAPGMFWIVAAVLAIYGVIRLIARLK